MVHVLVFSLLTSFTFTIRVVIRKTHEKSIFFPSIYRKLLILNYRVFLLTFIVILILNDRTKYKMVGVNHDMFIDKQVNILVLMYKECHNTLNLIYYIYSQIVYCQYSVTYFRKHFDTLRMSFDDYIIKIVILT